MVRILAGAMLLLSLSAQAAIGGVEQLYGTWEGTWYVDEHIYYGGNIVSVPRREESLMFVLHAWDGLLETYGYVSWAGGTPCGDVTGMSLAGQSVTLDTYYPQEGEPGGHATFTGLLSGSMLEGHYDEAANPNSGWEHWRGPARLYIPEPTTLALLVLGGLALIRRRRKQA